MKQQHYAFIRNFRQKHIGMGIGAAFAILVTVGILVALLVHTPLVSGAGQPLNGGPGYNNEGVSPQDGASTSASFDGASASYSSVALTALGFAPGYSVTRAGVTFLLPPVANGIGDNWQAGGQVVPVSVSGGGRVAFLGAASNGASSGAVLLTYTDGTTQSFTLTFSDWTLDGGVSQVVPQDTIVATMSYRDTNTGGRQTGATYLFYTSEGIPTGKTVSSVTLPNATTGGHLHIFAVGSTTAQAAYNSEGISPQDGAATSANFDNGGATYSNAALTAAGFAPGKSVTVGGATFIWSPVGNGADDNWLTSGQTLPVTVPSGGAVAFLGAAANGVSSGAGTIFYTDGSSQAFTLTFSDWTLNAGHSAPAPQDTTAAKMSYHDTSSGGRLTVTTYLFFTSTPTDPNKTVRSVRLPLSASGGRLHVFAVGNTTPSPSATTDWPTYLGDLGRSSYNATETTLGANNIAALRVRWQAHGAQGITMQPIEANNTLYWGSWDGLLHATSVSSGADIWTANLGQTHDTNCYPPTAGIASSATIGAIGATPVVFVGGGNATFYAVNAQTGAILWSTQLGSSPEHFIWSSPAVYNGSVYIGVASFGDCPLVPGKFFQLDVTTGAIQHTFSTTPSDTCLGGGVWSSPTIDTATNTLYFSTGNNGPCSASEPYAVSLIALRTTDLSLVSYWHMPSAQQGPDGDFGATATLFGATINGTQRAMIGLANKNGYYYAFDRTNLSAGPLWRTQIARSGDCPQCGDGSISPSAWDGVTLYVAGGATIINGVSCSGGVRALNPATGAVLWARCLQNSSVGPVLGAVTAIQGVVVVPTGKQVVALSATTGNAIFSYTDNASNSLFYGPVCIVNGHLYAGNLDGNFFAFGL